MKALEAIKRSTILRIMAAGVLAVVPGCGSNDFLGLEDYQRDLLAGGLLAAALLNQQANANNGDQPAPAPVDGRDGVDGLSCWDLDGDRIADPEEDVNGDGNFTALDCAGAAGADGQDGAIGGDGVSCWDLNGNGAGDPAEDINSDGMFDGLDCQGAVGPPGPPGAAGGSGGSGPPGPAGLSLFHLFIDDFFAAEGTWNGQLPVVLVSVEEPVIGLPPVQGTVSQARYDAVAYRAPVPEIYDEGNDVTMRIYFYRTGPHPEGCFVFQLDARRLRNGSDIEVYGDTRWIRVDLPESTEPDASLTSQVMPDSGFLLTVDLPVNVTPGLGFANDLEPADFLAFELSTHWPDGGAYQILGVEFYESRPGTAVLSGSAVFDSDQTIECGFEDCNENGIDDACDITCGEPGSRCHYFSTCGESEDCNENGIPDECDICDYDFELTAVSPQQEAEIEQAVVDGLAYLASIQNPDGSWSADWGQAAGDGGDCIRVALTALVVLKFEDRAMDVGYLDPMDPAFMYHEQVAKGLAYITSPSNIHTVDISSEPGADGDGDGIGLIFKDCESDHHDVYPTAITMMALASSRHPELYTDLLQDALDWMIFAQNNSNCGVHRGGWGYGANDCGWSDNSNGGYGSLGVGFAAASPPHGFGLTVPQFALDELNFWIDALQDPVNGDGDDGGSHYDPGGYWVNILKTGNLLYEMGMVGDTAETQRAMDAIDYIERHWNDSDFCSAGWLHDQQTMFTMMKGLEGLNIESLDLDGDGTADDDWFAEVAAHLISTQQPNGSWPYDCWGDQVLSTAWALLTLERAVAPPRPTGACCHHSSLMCEEDVFEEDCQGQFDEWSEGVRCDDLDPPCVPVECSPDCNRNGIPDECELVDNDCNENGVPDECEMGEPPSHNCCDADHGAGCTDELIEACVCESDPYCCDGEWDSDCVAEVLSFDCGSCTAAGDCNGNGVLDECDIDTETSQDCNGNDIPDECDIAQGASEDCNENGAPDDCDIDTGASDDCDQNGIPDECQFAGVSGIRISQESSPGAGDFDDHVLGTMEPFASTLSAADYYRYSLGFAASFNGAGMELTYERSHLFLVDNTDGLSLFVVHDRPSNADGGNANTRYEISGDPDGIARSVEDDPGDGYTGNPGDTVFTATHGWSPCCTDGLALTGLDGIWSVVMEFTSSISGMSDWAAYSPDQDPIPLTLVQGRRVRLDVVLQGEDCNENGVLDLCELEGNDCNENAVLDECDIADGTSQDLNENGVPDECEDV